MHRWTLWLCLALAPVPLCADPGQPQARAAAQLFGQALQQGQVSILRPLLPAQGKVQLRLVSLGPEQGSFSAGQVEALLHDFLQQGAVLSFETLRVEHDSDGYALVGCRAGIVDRQGRRVAVRIHLEFQPEGGRWVLRKIREASS